MKNTWRSAAVAAFAILLGSFAMLQGCGGGGGGGGSSAPPAAAPQSNSSSGAGRLSAVVRLTNRAAGRSAGQEISSTVNVTLTVSGVYAADDQEFPPVSTTATIDLSQGSASVSILDVPVGVNHLLTVTAEWGDGFTETLMALIPLIAEGELVTVTADPASTALAQAAIHFAEHENIRLADLDDEEIHELEEAIAFLHDSGIPYQEIQPSQVEAYLQNHGVPASVSLNAPTGPIVAGNTFQFTGEVLDGNGTAIAGATVTYTFSNPDAGTIDGNGLFTAVAAGDGVVTTAYQNFTATANVSVISVCAADTDCDDGDALTLDTCASAGTASAACEHTAIACSTAADCDDGDAFTHDECMNGGTLSASCAHHAVACNADTDCDDSNAFTHDACVNGGTPSATCEHHTIACNADADCDDANALTHDVCLNGGTPSASCEHHAIACSTDADCDDTNALTIDTCSNGGTMNASCANQSIACNTDADCDDANALTIDTCSNGGTSSAACNNQAITCNTDMDCDDADANTTDTCYNPGMMSATCGHSTMVSADITADTTWTLAGSPYIVDRQIAVTASATLNIDPGVEVWFQSPAAAYNDIFYSGYGNLAGILVSGALNANGTAMSPITMTIDPGTTLVPGGWGGIYFTYSSAGGSMNFVNMDYPSYAIQVDTVPVAISDINITNVGQPAGGVSYHIYTKSERGWVERAVEHYRMRYETRTIDLSGALPDADGEYKVRIKQIGMHAAHVDAAELVLNEGTYRVSEATDPAGSRDTAYKLAYADNDVFDAHEKTFDVRFDTSGLNATPDRAVLKLTAREENNAVLESGHAFTYPRNHQYDTVASSRYYTYIVGGSRGSLRADGEKSPADALPAPLFVERTVPMSGHPEGNTYGYVKNDGRYLYAAIDFTPDNTYDGEADYASVYVRVGNELKRFRVSVPERRYGSVGYTYTDAVNYQHKYYEFKIPLSEIGSPEPGDAISLIFDAYGTASLFYAAVSLYYIAAPVNVSNLNISFASGYEGYFNGVQVSSSQINAQNITITGSGGSGLYLYAADGSMFDNVNITTSINDSNLYVYYTTGAMFTGCTFNMAQNYSGAYIDSSSGISFDNCDFSYSPYGLETYYSGLDVTASRFNENCYEAIYSYGDGSYPINISNSNFTTNGGYAVYNGYSDIINLDSVYMAYNNGSPDVESSTALPDSDSQTQQYIGVTSLINQALTPNAVTPNVAGTQYCGAP